MNLFISTCIKLGIITLGIAVGFARQKQLSSANRMFWIFLLVALGGEILESLMGHYYGINYVYYHVFKPLYYTFLTLAFSSELGKLKNAFLVSIPTVMVLAILNGIFLQPPDKSFNTLIIVLICLLQVLQVLFYTARLFDRHNWQETMYQHSLWIALGLLVYSITSFLTLGIHNFLQLDGHKMVVPFLIVSEWIFYASFVLNFWIQQSRPEPG